MNKITIPFLMAVCFSAQVQASTNIPSTNKSWIDADGYTCFKNKDPNSMDVSYCINLSHVKTKKIGDDTYKMVWTKANRDDPTYTVLEQYLRISCSEDIAGVVHSTIYDKEGKVVSTADYPNPVMTYISPESYPNFSSFVCK